jgi:prophage maintenance system killer protein
VTSPRRLLPALTADMLATVAKNNGLGTELDRDAAARACAASAEHDNLLTAAGALLAAILTEAPLPAGNRNLAWDACATFLSVNGRAVTGRPDPAAVDKLIDAVTTGTITDPAAIGRAIASL